LPIKHLYFTYKYFIEVWLYIRERFITLQNKIYAATFMNNLLADNIRTKRLERGYKQEVLALECNMTQANISHIENGKVKPSEEDIEKIAQVLGTTPEELKYGVKEIKIEHHNHLNSTHPNQINIGVAYYQEDFEKERQSWKVIEQAKDETIKSQSITIGVLQSELERLRKG
jgi:transcriptional regulator with XRE-family HTH domain